MRCWRNTRKEIGKSRFFSDFMLRPKAIMNQVCHQLTFYLFNTTEDPGTILSAACQRPYETNLDMLIWFIVHGGTNIIPARPPTTSRPRRVSAQSKWLCSIGTKMSPPPWESETSTACWGDRVTKLRVHEQQQQQQQYTHDRNNPRPEI